MVGDINQVEEMLDVIDERGDTVEVLPKKEVIAKHLPHKTVHIEVFNELGEILVGLRSKEKKIYPNVWDSGVAGHISAGEGERETAIREMKEEIGIEVDPKYIGVVRVDTEVVDELIYVFIARYNGPFEMGEAVELKFVTIKEAMGLDSAPPFKKIISMLKEKEII